MFSPPPPPGPPRSSNPGFRNIPKTYAPANTKATYIPFAHWCESCGEAKSKQDHEKKNPEAGKDSVGVPYPIVQLDFLFQEKETPALVAICSWTRCEYIHVTASCAQVSASCSL